MSWRISEDLLPLENLELFQRKQMDLNQDYIFGDVQCILASTDDRPCPNGGSDLIFLMRYMVQKFIIIRYKIY